MDLIYIVLILMQVGIVIYFVRQGKKKAAMPAETPLSAYERQRKLAFSVTAGQLKLDIPDTQLFVFGVIMDWNMGEATVTLAAYITGAANMYFSTGEGITGGGKNPRAGEAAAELVAAAQYYLDRAIPVNTTDLPAPGCVRFHLLTNRRIYAAQDIIRHFEDGSSPWLPLFEKGNKVLTEIQAGNGKAAEAVVLGQHTLGL